MTSESDLILLGQALNEFIYRDLKEKALQKWPAREDRLSIDISELSDTERTTELASQLGSAERLEFLEQVVAAYQNTPSLETYLQLRYDLWRIEFGLRMVGH